MKKRILSKIIIGLLIIASPFAYSQNVSFNANGAAADPSAVWDLSDCTNGGFLLPWMTTAQMNSISTPITSDLIYNSSNNCYYAYFSGSSSWVQCYCLCAGGPATPGVISSTTTSPATGANETFSVTAVTGATSYTWTLPTGATITTGATTNSITAIMGCSSGNVSVTASNSCGTSAARTLAITGSGAAPATPGAISGSTDICSGSVTTYSVTAVAGAASYTWTVPAGSTITSGSTTNAIVVTMGSISGNVTVKATDACGTSTASTLAVTIESSAPATPTVTGTTPIAKNSTGNTFTATSATATSFTWTVPASIGTITAGQGTATITVTAASSAATANITCTATNACGTSASGSESVTISACTPSGTIALDTKNKSGVASNTLSITTATANELVVVACDGYTVKTTSDPVNFNGSVAITGAWSGAATYYDNVTTTQAEIAVYWFVAPTAGTYNITVNEGSGSGAYTEYDNFAVALKGFAGCSPPNIIDLANNGSNTASCFGGTCSSMSATVTESANSYTIGFYTDFWQSGPSPAWFGSGALGTLNSDANSSGHDDYAAGGKVIASAGTSTYSVEESGGAGHAIDYAVEYLLNVK